MGASFGVSMTGYDLLSSDSFGERVRYCCTVAGRHGVIKLLRLGSVVEPVDGTRTGESSVPRWSTDRACETAAVSVVLYDG